MRFDQEHRETAAKVLDNVVVVSERQVHEGYKRALAQLEGWHPDEAQRQGRWCFVGFGGPGESGPAMVRMFREANDMDLGRFNNLFHSLSDVPALKLTAADSIVFIDDFSGSGRQVTTVWPVIKELVASEARCYLLLTACTEAAEAAIKEKTELECFVDQVIPHTDNIFHEDSTTFSEDELAIIKSYCKIADPKNPRGFGKTGLLFVLSHKTPNNTIPILHVNEKDRWVGLFPRRLRAAA